MYEKIDNAILEVLRRGNPLTDEDITRDVSWDVTGAYCYSAHARLIRGRLAALSLNDRIVQEGNVFRLRVVPNPKEHNGFKISIA